ncbi:MAG: bifunctional homocysteine S-methyltransferase/methylenetetrahydrofolate reductase [Chloroflexi bacterium]|nr:bifunctional homocysteine S-methyltransferase/methylenetetrahydrofolate reductase [Chloroflexota bacterium]
MRSARTRSLPASTSEVVGRLSNEVLVCDGAMGTMLHAGGVSLDRSLPELNLSHADLVRSIHHAYIAAGATVIETNTFGATRLRLARFGLSQQAHELNRLGVKLARQAQAQARAPGLLVAGSVGPATPGGVGQRVAARELRDAFREQIDGLYEGGVDLLVFETFGSLSELVEAIGVATSTGSVPIVAQMTFVEDGRTLGGDSPEEVATTLGNLGVAVVGANCTLGPQGLLDVIAELGRWTNLPLAAQPNAGPPTLTEGRFQYTSSDPAYFGRYAGRFVELGATLVGGCCGTTPAHIEAVATAVSGLGPAPRLPAAQHAASHALRVETIEPQTATDVPVASVFDRAARGELVMACELPPPLGAQTERAVADARLLAAAGCRAVVVGPVGSTRAQASPASIALLVQQRVPEMEVILTATTWEKSLMVLQADLLGTYAFGIRHVVCRTGTPPLHGDYPNAAGVWEVDSLGLIEVLRGLNEGRDYNGIPVGRPTTFVIGARINPAAVDFEHEVAVARRKLAEGAHFLVTPPVYDLQALQRLLEAVDAPSQVPVLLGIMPLHDLRHAEYLQNEVPEMSVPPVILEHMWRAGESAPAVGRDIAVELFESARQHGWIHGAVLSSGSGSAAELATLLPALV